MDTSHFLKVLNDSRIRWKKVNAKNINLTSCFP